MAFPTEPKFVEAAEAALGARFPDSFRAHLLRSNGGEVEILEIPWELNPVHDASDRERDRRTAIDVIHETQEARKWRGFPLHAVSIGSDGCGNHLVFLLREGDSDLWPELYIWWHEGAELQRVAGDFSEAVPAC